MINFFKVVCLKVIVVGFCEEKKYEWLLNKFLVELNLFLS